MSNVYNIALGAINVTRKEIGLNSQNIANADVEGYTRLTMEKASRIINGEIAGVDVQGVLSNVDEVLQDTLYTKITEDSYLSTIKGYVQRMQEELGHPGSNDSIDSKIADVQIAMKNLDELPNSTTNRLLVLQSLENLTHSISSLAGRFEQFRFEADAAIGKSVTELNKYLESGYKYSNTMLAYPKGTLERTTVEDNFRKTMEKVSEYLEINKYYDADGVPRVMTAQGTSIIEDNQFFLKYTPVQSVSELVNDAVLNPVLVSYYAENGQDQYFDKSIVSGGKSEDVHSKISSGKIGAYVHLRDVEIPKALAQLDNLAKTIKDQFNKIHNQGASLIGPNKMSGTTLVQRNVNYGFGGQTRFVLLDNHGQQVPGVSALTLDMSKLDTGSGAGAANLEGIMQEIDYHFGKKISVDNSVQLGNLSDIKLASLNSAMTPSGTFNLDLELHNLATTGSTIQITNATAVDNLGANILNSFVNTSFNVAAGETTRTGATGPSLSLNIPSTIEYPFTVSLDVTVNDGTSNFTSHLTYTIDQSVPNAFNGLMNHRYSVATANNQGTVFGPAYTTPLLNAVMVNADGSFALDNSTGSGMLNLITSDSSYHIAIDNLTSQQNGNTGANIIGTGDNFSYYFGLNDLFVSKDIPQNYGNTKNAAYYMDLRSDIKADANKFSIGALQRGNDPLNPWQFIVSEGNTSNLKNLAVLGNQAVFFGPAGTLPATSVNFRNYASEIIGFNTASLARYQVIADQASLMRGAIQNRSQNLKGVNINEELAIMMVNQQHMVANARVLSVARELDQVLMNMFN